MVAPKTSERLTLLTEYTRKRLIPCLPILLKEAIELNIVSEIPWREGSIAYNISRRERFSHPQYDRQSTEMLHDKAYLGHYRRCEEASSKQANKDDGGKSGIDRHPENIHTGAWQFDRAHAQVEPHDDYETHAMTTRLKTLLDKYHETVMTKKHLESLELLDNLILYPLLLDLRQSALYGKRSYRKLTRRFRICSRTQGVRFPHRCR